VSARLERDLGAWTSGELERDRLLATHGAEAAGLVALHERLRGAADTPVPDVGSGWTALQAKLDAPAPVVPLRRPTRRRRSVSLLVAAALVTAGVAFAAMRGSAHEPTPSATVVPTVTSPMGGSDVHGPGDRSRVPPPSAPAAGPHRREPGPTGGRGGGSTTPDGSADGGGGSTSTDDPLDRDHGSGNDGSHDDNGSGNDGRSGTLPHGSHGHSH